MRRVAILQRVLPHYRATFFRSLHAALAEHQIALEVFYGDEFPGTVPKTVELDETWATKIVNRYVTIGGTEVVWQPAWTNLKPADLIVVEQASRLLLNYPLVLARMVRPRSRIAFWGHGRNYQAKRPSGPGEKLKRLLANQVDWWFAYTEMTADQLREYGVPPNRITVVDNSIDVSELETAASAVTVPQLDALRSTLGIDPRDRVAIYCGGFHRGKELGFLIEASVEIRARVPTFHLLLVGDGPEEGRLVAATRNHPWIHLVGPKFGPERVAYFRLSELLLMPAHVGLAIVDSFVTHVPLFATNHDNHSPEFAYLRNGVNGVTTEFTVESYASAVQRYLGDPAMKATLRSGCAESARLYTLDNMVRRFSSGIQSCLSTIRS